MSANPLMDALARDMGEIFGTTEPLQVIDLNAERIRREREASERRHRERHGEWTPTGGAA